MIYVVMGTETQAKRPMIVRNHLHQLTPKDRHEETDTERQRRRPISLHTQID